MVLTDIEGIYRNWGTSEQKLIKSITTDTLANMQFAAGTMAPKVKAVCNFIKKTRNKAYIGALKDAPMLLEEKAGTMIT
jgi:carbamate kinase